MSDQENHKSNDDFAVRLGLTFLVLAIIFSLPSKIIFHPDSSDNLAKPKIEFIFDFSKYLEKAPISSSVPITTPTIPATITTTSPTTTSITTSSISGVDDALLTASVEQAFTALGALPEPSLSDQASYTPIMQGQDFGITAKADLGNSTVLSDVLSKVKSIYDKDWDLDALIPDTETLTPKIDGIRRIVIYQQYALTKSGRSVPVEDGNVTLIIGDGLLKEDTLIDNYVRDIKPQEQSISKIDALMTLKSESGIKVDSVDLAYYQNFDQTLLAYKIQFVGQIYYVSAVDGKLINFEPSIEYEYVMDTYPKGFYQVNSEALPYFLANPIRDCALQDKYAYNLCKQNILGSCDPLRWTDIYAPITPPPDTSWGSLSTGAKGITVVKPNESIALTLGAGDVTVEPGYSEGKLTPGLLFYSSYTDPNTVDGPGKDKKSQEYLPDTFCKPAPDNVMLKYPLGAAMSNIYAQISSGGLGIYAGKNIKPIPVYGSGNTILTQLIENEKRVVAWPKIKARVYNGEVGLGAVCGTVKGKSPYACAKAPKDNKSPWELFFDKYSGVDNEIVNHELAHVYITQANPLLGKSKLTEARELKEGLAVFYGVISTLDDYEVIVRAGDCPVDRKETEKTYAKCNNNNIYSSTSGITFDPPLSAKKTCDAITVPKAPTSGRGEGYVKCLDDNKKISADRVTEKKDFNTWVISCPGRTTFENCDEYCASTPSSNQISKCLASGGWSIKDDSSHMCRTYKCDDPDKCISYSTSNIVDWSTCLDNKPVLRDCEKEFPIIYPTKEARDAYTVKMEEYRKDIAECMDDQGIDTKTCARAYACNEDGVNDDPAYKTKLGTLDYTDANFFADYAVSTRAADSVRLAIMSDKEMKYDPFNNIQNDPSEALKLAAFLLKFDKYLKQQNPISASDSTSKVAEKGYIQDYYYRAIAGAVKNMAEPVAYQDENYPLIPYFYAQIYEELKTWAAYMQRSGGTTAEAGIKFDIHAEKFAEMVNEVGAGLVIGNSQYVKSGSLLAWTNSCVPGLLAPVYQIKLPYVMSIDSLVKEVKVEFINPKTSVSATPEVLDTHVFVVTSDDFGKPSRVKSIAFTFDQPAGTFKDISKADISDGVDIRFTVNDSKNRSKTSILKNYRLKGTTVDPQPYFVPTNPYNCSTNMLVAMETYEDNIFNDSDTKAAEVMGPLFALQGGSMAKDIKFKNVDFSSEGTARQFISHLAYSFPGAPAVYDLDPSILQEAGDENFFPDYCKDQTAIKRGTEEFDPKFLRCTPKTAKAICDLYRDAKTAVPKRYVTEFETKKAYYDKILADTSAVPDVLLHMIPGGYALLNDSLNPSSRSVAKGFIAKYSNARDYFEDSDDFARCTGLKGLIKRNLIGDLTNPLDVVLLSTAVAPMTAPVKMTLKSMVLQPLARLLERKTVTEAEIIAARQMAAAEIGKLMGERVSVVAKEVAQFATIIEESLSQTLIKRKAEKALAQTQFEALSLKIRPYFGKGGIPPPKLATERQSVKNKLNILDKEINHLAEAIMKQNQALLAKMGAPLADEQQVRNAIGKDILGGPERSMSVSTAGQEQLKSAKAGEDFVGAGKEARLRAEGVALDKGTIKEVRIIRDAMKVEVAKFKAESRIKYVGGYSAESGRLSSYNQTGQNMTLGGTVIKPKDIVMDLKYKNTVVEDLILSHEVGHALGANELRAQEVTKLVWDSFDEITRTEIRRKFPEVVSAFGLAIVGGYEYLKNFEQKYDEMSLDPTTPLDLPK